MKKLLMGSLFALCFFIPTPAIAFELMDGFDEPAIDDDIIFSQPVNVNLPNTKTQTIRSFK